VLRPGAWSTEVSAGIREGIVDRRLWLKVAAVLSFSMAACQAVISVWPAAAGYFQAPPSLLNDRVRLFVVGGAAALIPVLFGLYALSGAGVIRRLPLLRTVLVAIGSLFLLRGLFIIVTFLVVMGILQGRVSLPGVASHLVFLAAGVVYLGGAVVNWKTLRSR
jgi:di/tricarboxylate transporter